MTSSSSKLQAAKEFLIANSAGIPAGFKDKVRIQYDEEHGLRIVIDAHLAPYEYSSVGAWICDQPWDFAICDGGVYGQPSGSVVVFIDPEPELLETLKDSEDHEPPV